MIVGRYARRAGLRAWAVDLGVDEGMVRTFWAWAVDLGVDEGIVRTLWAWAVDLGVDRG